MFFLENMKTYQVQRYIRKILLKIYIFQQYLVRTCKLLISMVTVFLICWLPLSLFRWEVVISSLLSGHHIYFIFWSSYLQYSLFVISTVLFGHHIYSTLWSSYLQYSLFIITTVFSGRQIYSTL